MILTRRGFLSSILSLSAAPAIVRASSLMSLHRVYYSNYSPFARVGTLYVPYWQLYNKGDCLYNIVEDEFLTCCETDIRLELKLENWIEKDFGLSPKQLGYCQPEGNVLTNNRWTLPNDDVREIKQMKL